MADQKISQFTRLSSLDGKEEIPVAKGNFVPVQTGI